MFFSYSFCFSLTLFDLRARFLLVSPPFLKQTKELIKDRRKKERKEETKEGKSRSKFEFVKESNVFS